MPHRLSAYRTARNRTDGFTLAELLVVVAIVAILVAIAVPVFTSALGNTEEATCSANRRSVKSLYTTTWLLDQTTNRDSQVKMFDDCVAKLKEQNKGVLCPNDGKYRASFNKKTGAISVTCLIHGASDEDRVNDFISSNSWSGGNDSDHRDAYANANDIDKWPDVLGTDNKPVYLAFKTYGNSSDTAYLFAGKAQSTSDSNPWRANYICDTTGEIFGTPGQWYALPSEINLGTKPDSTGANLKAKLAETYGENFAETLDKVNLENGKFVKG
ncbi:prepilin-type N-terminal cleavage/methylation domain-containing protein [Eggerthella sinensis]|uniref:prepilin-type N-terminal cleavage/methylation domain-containing protein n=1 Tax=Eggerthella sinensis TaxID=242230 RepID=UPI00248F02B9|nr:prepilin-type N-terminal cleavage/methylation domain-containing protein [Eggerthella sinensis]